MYFKFTFVTQKKKDSMQAQKRNKWNNCLHFCYSTSKYQMQITLIKAMGNHHFSEPSG